MATTGFLRKPSQAKNGHLYIQMLRQKSRLYYISTFAGGNYSNQRNLATAESYKEHRGILLINEDVET